MRKSLLPTLQAIFYRPFYLLIIVLVVLAIVTRFYQLGSVPHGITWDEAAIGYNGYAVITTRRDEWLHRLPVSFQSFGDYKAPLAIYVVGISAVVFDLSAFSVRLPFAASGVIFVVAFGFLIRYFFSFSKHKNVLAVLGMFFALTSPWHFHYSRVGFESGIALTLITVAILGLKIFEALIKSKNLKLAVATLVGSGLLFVASMYTYHSAKVFVPIILLYLAFYFKKSLFKIKWYSLLAIVISIAALFPLLQDSLYGPGAQRASVLLTAQGLSPFELVITVLKNIFLHLTPSFLLFNKVDSLRHGIGFGGVLTPLTVAMICFGFLWLVSKKSLSGKYRSILYLAVASVCAGILPAALSAETVPHTNRALLALPGFLMLSVLGTEWLIEYLSKWGEKLSLRLVIGTIILIESLFFISLWKYYFSSFAYESASAFQDGYVEAFTIAEQYEKGRAGKQKVDKIIFASEYGQSYIYALFVKKSSPIYYRGGSLNHYLLVDTVDSSALLETSTLVVASPRSGLPENQADYIVRGSDGSARFLIFYPR